MATSIFELLVADLPAGFARELLQRMSLVYAEAHESVTNDPRFGEPEVRYLHGHVRRALVEKSLRDIAEAYGMSVELRRADGAGGPEHVVLYAGRFRFTACHLSALRDFPQESRHREQYSSINEHATQLPLFSAQSFPPEFGIYAIVVHREAVGDKSVIGTLSIGVPNEACDDWIEEPIALAAIAEAQVATQSPLNAPKPAEPKWKNESSELVRETR